jgi:pimeloyl-ACP methyl ester carboxylesterase
LSWIPHHALVGPEGEHPRAWLLFLHGILGSGSNWRSIARRLVAARPDWGAVLVDLRMHGRSQDAPPPHTLEAAAVDLERLAAHLEARGMRVAGLIGHSFGGKTALACRARAPRGLLETWVLDASPSASPETRGAEDPARSGGPRDGAADVVRMLGELPGQFSSRDEFLDSTMQRGIQRPMAEWLAMNLERDGDRFRLRLDLAAIRALLADYQRRDLWPAVESAQPGALRFVVAGRSSALGEADRRRLDALASANPSLGVHVVAEAGHWLHIDAPDRLLALFSEELARPPAA